MRVGFSNLVARLDSDEIGFAKAEYRVHILEALRGAGFNAVGAESLVFNRDDRERAELVLGGTVRELECRQVHRQSNCRIGITWELLDVERDAVVYRALSRYIEMGADRSNAPVVGRKLALGALREVMGRPRFAELLKAKREALPDENHASAGFRSCTSKAHELPAQFNDAADATYLVKQSAGFGSGFGISPDGLVITAAHVVSGRKVELIRRGQTTPLQGVVVRVSRKHDVALIAIEGAGTEQPCLEVEPALPTAGDDVYAIGSPASQELAFSLSRGIVSGLRLQAGVQLVQTDASLSPGNSGGPLLDRHARVVGVVTKKIAGQAMEGLGFGVQIADALHALALEPQPATEPTLLQSATADTPTPAAQQLFVDTDSPQPSFDPEADRRREVALDYERRAQLRAAATPRYIKPMRWLGAAAALGGSLGAVLSANAAGADRMSPGDYSSYRLQNDISWAVLALGSAAFVLSFTLEPRVPPAEVKKKAEQKATLSVAVGTGQINLGMRL